jgi:hypothetical protein
MADSKSLMQHQMEAIKDIYGNDIEIIENEEEIDKSGQEQDREIAELYEDLYQYKMDLACFEKELELVKENDLFSLLDALEKEKFDTRDYKQDLLGVLEHNWKQKCEQGIINNDQLSVFENKNFNEVLQKLIDLNSQDILDPLKSDFIKRWELLIEIKKEHIKDETAEIKVTGLKPYYAERVYKRFHGIK